MSNTRWTTTTRRSSTRCSFAATWNRGLAEKFVGMYVNHYTLDAGDIVPKAAQKLLDLGFEAGLGAAARGSGIRPVSNLATDEHG